MRSISLKHLLSLLILTGGLYSCSSSTDETPPPGGDITPTMGLETTLEESADGEFLIVDEQEVGSPEDSRMFINYLDGHADTVSLAEAKMITDNTSPSDTSRQTRAVHRGGMGFFGWYFLGRMAMGGMRPSAGVYRSQSTFNSVQNGAASRINNTATRSTRPGAGRSYGGGRSTRSVGG